MLSDLLRKERKWKGPCKLGVQFSIRSFGISTRSHLVHIHPFCPGLPPGWVSSHIRFPFSRRSFRPFGLSFSSRLLPSSGVVPCALTINQACQFVMAILCVHLGRAVQTPQPTLSSLLPSSRPLCPLRPARRGVRSPRHSISGQLVEDGGWREGDSSPLSLSLSSSTLLHPYPSLVSSSTVAGHQPAGKRSRCHWWDIGRWRKRERASLLPLVVVVVRAFPLPTPPPLALPRGPPRSALNKMDVLGSGIGRNCEHPVRHPHPHPHLLLPLGTSSKAPTSTTTASTSLWIWIARGRQKRGLSRVLFVSFCLLCFLPREWGRDSSV